MKTALTSPLPSIDLSEILKFSHVFQPIYSLPTGTVLGYESLIRGEQIKNPQLLFAMARNQQKLFELDVSSVMKSMFRFDQWISSRQTANCLAVNIYPSTLLHPSFLFLLDEVMKRVNLPAGSIIFELNEAETVENVKELQKTVRYLKNIGFMIALDDLGKGQSSLRLALDLEPNIVKLDQYFCADLENSMKKQRFLEWISSYFLAEETWVTLEGIETESQLTIAKQVGIPYGQGFHLGKPLPFKNYL